MRFAPLLAACLLAGSLTPAAAMQAQPAAQSAVDSALVAKALAASDDETRAALFAAHPEIVADAIRQAIAQAATSKRAEGDLQSAFNGYRTLLYVTTAAGHVRGRISALNFIGTTAGQLGDFAVAEPALVEARRAADAAGHVDLLITATNNLGIVQRQQGKFDDAIDSYRRTLALAEQAGRKDTIARALNNLGIVAQQRGDARAALEYLTRSAAISESLPQTPDMTSAYFNLGMLHHYQRNFALAHDYYERSRAEATRKGDRRSLVAVLSNIGHLRLLQGQNGPARQVLDEALAVAEEQGERIKTATVLHNLGSLARLERRWTDAEAAHRRSLAIREAAGDKPNIAESLAGLSELFEQQGKFEQALAFAERSVAVAREIGFAHGLWGALSLVGSANAALGRTEPAVRALQESIEIIESIRRQVAGGAEDLQRFFEDKSEPYVDLAAVLAASGRPAEAFAAIERARARVLLDRIESGQPITRTLTEAERAREIELDRELVSLNVRLEAAARLTPPQPARVRELEEALARTRRAKADWQFAAYGAHPDLRFSRGEAPVVSFEDAASLLTADSGIVMFMSSANHTRMLLLTRPRAAPTPTLQIFTLPIARDDLAQRTEAFNQQLARRDLGFAATARALYDVVLGPADRHLTRIRRLVIVPDDAMWQVPFQALMTPRGRFVIEERTVSYAPSVSALYRLQERRQSRTHRATRLVALGDPETTGAAATRLPEAAREVQSLAAMYGAGSEAFVGTRATEERLRASAPAASVLHIATHGELDSSSPMYSYVALGGGGHTPDLTRDGRVEAWEIANMSLQADLAVLSACETARGQTRGGEGVIGLSWSLFAAGASTAAVSLWRVDSSSTTELMLAFHRSLLDQPGSASPAAAMQTAARALLATSQYRHPFYWAGFVVIGAN